MKLYQAKLFEKTRKEILSLPRDVLIYRMNSLEPTSILYYLPYSSIHFSQVFLEFEIDIFQEWIIILSQNIVWPMCFDTSPYKGFLYNIDFLLFYRHDNI